MPTDTILTIRCPYCMAGIELRPMVAHKPQPAGEASLPKRLGNVDCYRASCNPAYNAARKINKPVKHSRPPRIRVPNREKAIFTVDNQKFVGIVQRLSLTGGSALLVKGPIPEGTLGEMALGTVLGKVNAHIEFLHTELMAYHSRSHSAFLRWMP